MGCEVVGGAGAGATSEKGCSKQQGGCTGSREVEGHEQHASVLPASHAICHQNLVRHMSP